MNNTRVHYKASDGQVTYIDGDISEGIKIPAGATFISLERLMLTTEILEL